MTKPAENPFASLPGELATGFIGKNIVYYPRLSSTMDAARVEAGRGAPEGTVIMAGEQTGGRGRLRRTWFTPPGNIALSIIVYPGLAALPYLIMVAALAAARAVEKTSGLEAQIKWPNDVLVGGKKVCGILIENGVKAGGAPFSIVGIGINVGLRPGDIGDIAATSLTAAADREVSSRLVAKYIFEEFERLYRQLPEGKPVFEAWRGRLVNLGKQVAARWGDSVIEGVAEAVAEDGALAIRQADGTLARVVAGDVTLSDK
jgi:BirA family transcriptional regulator, biotin operon repressor / biotin---[acetyl-CoA-carboxylase] ligase